MEKPGGVLQWRPVYGPGHAWACRAAGMVLANERGRVGERRGWVTTRWPPWKPGGAGYHGGLVMPGLRLGVSCGRAAVVWEMIAG
jgi:hypothetical protein